MQTEQIFARSKPSRRSIVSNIDFTMESSRRRRATPLSNCDLSTDVEEVETSEKPRAKKLTKLMKKSWSKSVTRGLRLKRKLSSKMSSSKSKIHETLTPANAPICTTSTQKKTILGSNQEEVVEDVVIWEEKYYPRSKSSAVLAFL